MNVYIFFVGCLFLTLGCWIIFRDIFSPVSILCEVFTISGFFAILSAQNWETDIALTTCLFLIGQLVLSAIIAFCIERMRTWRGKPESPRPIAVNKKRYQVAMWIVVVLTAVYSLYYAREILTNPGQALAQMLSSFRQTTITVGTRNIPIVIQYSSKITYAFAYFSAYLFIHDLLIYRRNGGQKPRKLYLISIVLLVVAALLTGARAELIYFACFVVTVVSVIRSKLYKRTFRISYIFKMFGYFVLLLGLFYLISNLIGRSSKNFITVISNYIGSPIITLDRYLKDPVSSSEIWGKESFYSVIHLLQKLGIIGGEDVLVHLDYMYINGHIYTNVFTTFRAYVNDFGVFGSFLVQAVFVVFYEQYYVKCKLRKNQLGYVNTGILVYGLISYGVFLAFYSNYLFGLILSIHTVIEIALIHFFKWFTSPGKLRFSFKLRMGGKSAPKPRKRTVSVQHGGK